MEKKIEHDLAWAGLLEPDDVLKIGHHGSRTSTTPEFLDRERPVFRIISAGFDNSYGHPTRRSSGRSTRGRSRYSVPTSWVWLAVEL
jgi:competence protein ComEC